MSGNKNNLIKLPKMYTSCNNSTNISTSYNNNNTSLIQTKQNIGLIDNKKPSLNKKVISLGKLPLLYFCQGQNSREKNYSDKLNDVKNNLLNIKQIKASLLKTNKLKNFILDINNFTTVKNKGGNLIFNNLELRKKIMDISSFKCDIGKNCSTSLRKHIINLDILDDENNSGDGYEMKKKYYLNKHFKVNSLKNKYNFKKVTNENSVPKLIKKILAIRNKRTLSEEEIKEVSLMTNKNLYVVKRIKSIFKQRRSDKNRKKREEINNNLNFDESIRIKNYISFNENNKYHNRESNFKERIYEKIKEINKQITNYKYINDYCNITKRRSGTLKNHIGLM